MIDDINAADAVFAGQFMLAAGVVTFATISAGLAFFQAIIENNPELAAKVHTTIIGVGR